MEIRNRHHPELNCSTETLRLLDFPSSPDPFETENNVSDTVPVLELTILKNDNDDENDKNEIKKEEENKHLVKYIDNHSMSQYSTLLGFKIADFCKDAKGKEPLLNVYVLVILEFKLVPGGIIESDKLGYKKPIETSNDLMIARWNEAHQEFQGVKYCIPHATVVGIMFLGNPNVIQEAIKLYHEQRGFICSKFNPQFHYQVEQDVYEPKFGQVGKSGCAQGIHFFLDAKYACNFGAANGLENQYPIITKRIYSSPKNTILMISKRDEKDWEYKVRDLTIQEKEKRRIQSSLWSMLSSQTRELAFRKYNDYYGGYIEEVFYENPNKKWHDSCSVM